jgi:peroxiredoxin (alkyl hydroperoxide reductase subunit C)
LIWNFGILNLQSEISDEEDLTMQKRRLVNLILIIGVLSVSVMTPTAFGLSDAYKGNIYQVGTLKPIDSVLKVKVGDRAPNFTLPSISGEKVSLSQFLGKKNVVLSFVPAAWTPVCSDQWPGYNISKDIFNQYDALLLGITVDNIPTLFAWTNQMGQLWFPVLSDFWPHGEAAKKYGVLRSDGVSERALFVIDKKGIIRYIDVHDINKRPPLEDLMGTLEKLK